MPNTRILKARIKIRTDTSEGWYDINPLLLLGEIGIEEDTGLCKMGTGKDRWNDLPHRTLLEKDLLDSIISNIQEINERIDGIQPEVDSKILSALGDLENDGADPYVRSSDINIIDVAVNGISVITEDRVADINIPPTSISNFIEGNPYKKHQIVVVEEDESFHVYRAKDDIAPDEFNKEDWEYLGLTNMGNIDGGKPSSICTLSQVINGGRP